MSKKIKYVLELTELEYLTLLSATGSSTGSEGGVAYDLYVALADADRASARKLLDDRQTTANNVNWDSYVQAAQRAVTA